MKRSNFFTNFAKEEFFSFRNNFTSYKKYVLAGLPDFSWYKIPKREKYIKWLQNVPNGRKIDQMAIKYTNIFHCKTLQNLPKLGLFLV
jgi:hypothetical protein